MDHISLILLTNVVMFFAGITQGFTGFGISVVSIPILVHFFPPKIVISAMIIWTFLFPLPIIFDGKKWLNLKRIMPLVISGVIFMPLGTFLLLHLSTGTIKIITGLVVVLFSLLIISGVKKRVKNEKLVLPLVGVLSGTLKGMISMSGPPIVLFLTNQSTMKHAFRVNLTAYFFLQNIAALFVFGFSGLINRDSVFFAAAYFPAMISGILFGIALTRFVREVMFRRIVLAVVLLSGISAIFSGLKFYK